MHFFFFLGLEFKSYLHHNINYQNFPTLKSLLPIMQIQIKSRIFVQKFFRETKRRQICKQNHKKQKRTNEKRVKNKKERKIVVGGRGRGAYTNNGIGIIVVVEAILGDAVAVDVADRVDVGGPRIDGVEIVQRASDVRVRRSHAKVLQRNPSRHSWSTPTPTPPSSHHKPNRHGRPIRFSRSTSSFSFEEEEKGLWAVEQ